MKNIKTTAGHLTTGNKKAIQAILNAGLTSGKVGRTNYFLEPSGDEYTVKIVMNDRGLMPVPGSKLRTSTSTHKFILQ